MSKKEVPHYRKVFQTPEGKHTLNPFVPGKTEDGVEAAPEILKEALGDDGKPLYVPMNRKARRINLSNKNRKNRG